MNIEQVESPFACCQCGNFNVRMKKNNNKAGIEKRIAWTKYCDDCNASIRSKYIDTAMEKRKREDYTMERKRMKVMTNSVECQTEPMDTRCDTMKRLDEYLELVGKFDKLKNSMENYGHVLKDMENHLIDEKNHLRHVLWLD